jgi:steroid delta-isomerase-like uncharacterized protein
MTHPHPAHAGFADAYSRAWTSEPVELLDFFAAEGTYTDVPMTATYSGREEIARFHRWMLKFAPDSVITFSDACAADARLYLRWIWSGTFGGALRLPDGSSVQSTGANFTIPGVAACRYDANGQLRSHCDYWDLNTLLSQIGAARQKPHLPA